jgi:hypothetical protein
MEHKDQQGRQGLQEVLAHKGIQVFKELLGLLAVTQDQQVYQVSMELTEIQVTVHRSFGERLLVAQLTDRISRSL